MSAADSPYQAGAPWPCMRADLRNSGRSPLLHEEPASRPELPLRRWSTGNGIFSTPVIGADETIYVGSADKSFYALDPLSGATRWQFPTGECIDSAGCVAADGTVYFVSCDAGLYALAPSGEERWRLNLFENRRHFTPSTIFWWEGNVVLGPNHWLYAGNDDFNFYAIEPGRGARWAYLTGLHIWTAPAFGHDDDSVCFLSFDRHCYKLDRRSGRLLWRTNTGNFVVSSPAIGNDGRIFFGSFDGNVYALHGELGSILWRVPTGGPIYASPALAEDGMLYIGSSDGCLYAIDTGTATVAWSFYTGDAVRASAAIGRDPEQRCAYLIYFGSGNGTIYCLEPDGTRRWSLSTAGEGGEVDSPNINASIALGRFGLAAATASGKVFYVPFDYYRSHPDDPLIDCEGGDGYPREGLHLYVMSPGGRMARRPIEATMPPLAIDPVQPISLRLLARRGGRTQLVQIDPQSVEVSAEPSRELRVTVQPDRTQLNVIPEQPLFGAAAGRLELRARCLVAGQAADEVGAVIPLEYSPPAEAPPIEQLVHQPIRITHMSVYDPPIVPSFDQIGIASLTIQLRVVDVDPASGGIVAWGLLKFGVAEVQVAIARHLFYAFAGTYRDGRIVLTAHDCNFELTAFPAPLDRLRLSGSWTGADGPRIGSSLVAELDVSARLSWDNLRDRLSGLGRGSHGMMEFVGRWFPDWRTAFLSLPAIGRFLARALPLSLQILRRSMYGPWGLIGEDGWFRGIGSFHSSRDEARDPSAIAIQSFALAPGRREVIAEIESAPGHPGALDGVVPGILLVDLVSHQPARLAYDAATTIVREGERVRIELALPAALSGRWCAWLLADVTPLQSIEFDSH